MMMAQLWTPGYKWQARWSWSPVTASSSWRDLWWTLDLDTAEEDYRLRRQMTASWPRAGIIIMGKSNLWRARPNPAASAELVVPLRKANGPIFQNFCQGTEQRSLGSTRLLLMLS